MARPPRSDVLVTAAPFADSTPVTAPQRARTAQSPAQSRRNSQRMMPLSAAEVLAGGLAVKNAAGMGSVWGKPAAPLKPPVKALAAPARPRPAPSAATLLHDNDSTACAATALLGLQKEPVSIARAALVVVL